MKHSESIASIIPKLIKAQSEVSNPEKNKTAKAGSFSYKYADLPAVLDCVKPVLSKLGIAVIQTTSGLDATRLLLVTTLIDSSGEWVSSELPVDVSQLSPQEIGAELTYFRRYSICGLLNIHGDEDTDAVGISKPKTAQPAVKQAQVKQEPSEFKQIANRAVSRAQTENKPTQRSGIKALDTDTILQWRAKSFDEATVKPAVYDAMIEAERELHERGITISKSIKDQPRPLGVTQ